LHPWQFLLASARFRNGHPYAQLTAGFGIGTTTAYRYITEAVDLPAALAATLAEVAQAASTKVYAPLYGSLLPTRGEPAAHHHSPRPPAVGLTGSARGRPRRTGGM
jgi:hypothetical protein